MFPPVVGRHGAFMRGTACRNPHLHGSRDEALPNPETFDTVSWQPCPEQFRHSPLDAEDPGRSPRHDCAQINRLTHQAHPGRAQRHPCHSGPGSNHTPLGHRPPTSNWTCHCTQGCHQVAQVEEMPVCLAPASPDRSPKKETSQSFQACPWHVPPFSNSAFTCHHHG